MKTFKLYGAMVLLLGLAFGFNPVFALDAEQEKRYYDLLNTLRCLVCQNQSLADSAAGLADDLRAEVHKMVERGLSDEEIFFYMTERYGDYVLYEPPVKPHTYALWFGPFVLLLLVLLVLLMIINRRSRMEDRRAGKP